MKAVVITTITSMMDLDTFEGTHSVDINDQDGLSEVSGDLLGALLIGAVRSTERGLRERFPGADRSAKRVDAKDGK